MQKAQISNVQVLRGVAALLIVIYHIQPFMNDKFNQSLHSHFAVFGVDIFFIISGFVMFFTNQSMTRAPSDFIIDRFFRIVPLYWLATALMIACFMIGFRPVGLHVLNGRIIAESLAFIPSMFPGDRHDLIVSVGWTLMYELFFYLAFALTFALRSQIRSFVALSVLFGVLIAIGRLDVRLPHLAIFYTSPIIVEFLYGAALAILYARWSGGNPAPWLAPLGLALLLVGFGLSLALDVARVPVPNKHDTRFLILGIPALFIVAGALAMERGGWIWRARFPLLLGSASYALYLFHPLILHIVVKASAMVLPMQNALSPLVAALVAIVTCITSAILIHLLIERPILHSGKKVILQARPLRVAMATDGKAA